MDLDEVTWSAPGRVVLVGDHTDHDGGLALPFAVDARTRVAARRRTGGVVVARSAGHPGRVAVGARDAPGTTTGWGAYVAGVVWALRRAGVDVPGADLQITGEVPAGAGLSSSHALLVAAGAALLDLAGEEWKRDRLAAVVQRAENDYVGTPSGVLDQTVLLHARADHLLLVDAGAAGAPGAAGLTQVPWPGWGSDVELLVVDTCVPHVLSDGAYAHLRADVRRAAAALGVVTLRSLLDDVGLAAALEQVERRLADDDPARRRARHVLTENARVREAVALCAHGTPTELGAVLDASQASQRLDLRNTVPAVDLAVETLLDAGALGARMTGGGFGGSVVAVVPAGATDEAGGAVGEAYARAGLSAPRTFAVRPSGGARREDG